MSKTPHFTCRLAQNEDDLRAAQRLRYRVFVEELGGDGALVDHSAELEVDHFDPYCKHLLLLDEGRGETVDAHCVGVYRLMDEAAAQAAGGFYTAGEFNLDPLLASGRKVLELGRSCLHSEYRGGMAMYHLWHALAGYVLSNETNILFGTASFHGTDANALAAPLSLLHARHLAPEALRVTAKDPATRMDLVQPDVLDKRAAMLGMPSLIKAYLRLGGFVGQGAYLDHAFNTTDVCLILDLDNMNPKQRKLYEEARTP